MHMPPAKSRLYPEIDFDAPGKRTGFLRLPHSVHRSAYGWVPIPIVAIANGTGPRVLLMGGNHGDEYEGQVALGKLIRALDPGEVQGRIIILPSANFPAAMAGSRTSPIDQGNLNRSFPGDPDGGPTAQIAYYIESEGEVAIVDPLRDTDEYIKLAKERNAGIKYIFETHFHADFVSGHIDLANQTGATIVFGPLAETNYNVYNAKDGEEFKLGDITIRAIHTPGHTPESTCYLLLDESYQEYSIFTGDTLFVGDVIEEQRGKIRLAGLWTQAGELGNLHMNQIIPVRTWIGKRVE